jgi:hypothetical protein
MRGIPISGEMLNTDLNALCGIMGSVSIFVTWEINVFAVSECLAMVEV